MPTYRVTWDGPKLRHGEVKADSPSEAWTKAVMQCQRDERVNYIVERASEALENAAKLQ